MIFVVWTAIDMTYDRSTYRRRVAKKGMKGGEDARPKEVHFAQKTEIMHFLMLCFKLLALRVLFFIIFI